MAKDATFYQHYFQKGISYAQYYENISNEATQNPTEGYSKYVPQNFQRVKRITKTLVLLPELIAQLQQFKNNIRWLVISEHWCGDAAQIVPVIAAIAEQSEGKIDLRIVYRDEDTQLIDEHLTNKGRSIPKLIALDAAFDYQYEWGPRPKTPQEMVMRAKAEGMEHDKMAEIIHKWYADNKQKEIQMELKELLV
ncbi:MAG: thioredoxin family protein [Cytophagales bacterium]|nr:MAG: thioredoxin family protein [Cytophagales bacterium]